MTYERDTTKQGNLPKLVLSLFGDTITVVMTGEYRERPFKHCHTVDSKVLTMSHSRHILTTSIMMYRYRMV